MILTTDVPTLFGVATGLAIFTALICFVLKLFSRARYSRPRHYANANLAPPILFSSETGQCSLLPHNTLCAERDLFSSTSGIRKICWTWSNATKLICIFQTLNSWTAHICLIYFLCHIIVLLFVKRIFA